MHEIHFWVLLHTVTTQSWEEDSPSRSVRIIIKCFLYKIISGIVIGVEQFNSSHTARAIADKLMDILTRFLIDKKVAYVVSDSAANMCKGN